MIYSLLIVSGSPNTLLVGTGQGVFKSTNGGSTWSVMNTGLPGDTKVYALAHDTTTSRLYAGGNNGVFVLAQP
jgi:ligand-binding sensor domain-containing protein